MKSTRGLILLAVLLVSCRRPVPGPAVEVIDDPSEIRAARRVWQERRSQALANLLENPGWVRSYDHESLEILRSHREQALKSLRDLRDNGEAGARLRLEALLALRFLDEPASIPLMVELARSDPEAAGTLLDDLYDLYRVDDDLPVEIRQAIASWVTSTDERLRKDALRQAGLRKVNEAAAPVSEQLPSARDEDRELFLTAATLVPSAELLARLEKRLKPRASPLSAPEGLDAIRALGESTLDPVLRRQAAEIVTRVLCEQREQTWIDGETLSCLDLIGSVSPPSDAERLLTRIVKLSKWGALRHSALERIARGSPATAEALSRQSGVTLKRPQSDSGRPEVPSATEGARILVAGGVLTEQEAEMGLAKLRERAGETQDEQGPPSALDLLEASGRLLNFDTETSMVPNRHDLLIRDFARASGGRFAPEAEFEWYTPNESNPETGSYLVQFLHSGRLYRFRPQDLGDWYDVEAVTAAIEKALKDSGGDERFVMMETGDQTATFVFGPPARVLAVGPRLALVPASDPGAPQKAGKAFEEEALGKIRK